MEEKKKILVVEDEDAMRKMLSLELEAAGHEVHQAENGEVGLGLVKEILPDLIISDVLMPKMDGFTFYKELKKSKVTSDIPVLILTARGKMEDSFRVVGADDFIAKPFEPEDLHSKIERLLNRSQSVVDSEVQAGMRVLVAGDDDETVENMIVQLKRAGCHTDLVTTGAQVISKVVMFLPQILVMEVMMEGIESPKLVQMLRQMPQSEKIPILMYSFYRLADLGSEDVRQRALAIDAAEANCMDAGATEYFGRFNENTFIKTISKYLK